MILISHRGNVTKKIPELENHPTYIDNALNDGFDVEIDVWLINDVIYLGHDSGDYKVELDFFQERKKNLWVHCKNIESLIYFNSIDIDINYFWHENDTVTLTSKNYIWAFPGKQPISGSIAVMPEIYNDEIVNCLGVCSDYIINYK